MVVLGIPSDIPEKFPWELEEREILVKSESETDPNYGKPPEERSVEELLKCGLVIIDKPAGPTSHQVADWVKKILEAEKAGHSGTLDPKVTGVLPVGINKGTRVLETLITAGKEYVGVMVLHEDVPIEKLVEAFKKFTGEIIQIPPVRSAVKRRPRKKHVYYLKILEKEGKYVLFKAGVEAGTYIRKLCWDIGQYLGVGAHMAKLRRTRVGGLHEDEAVLLQDLEDAYFLWKECGIEKELKKILKPIEVAVQHMKKVWVHDTCVGNVAYGAPVYVIGISKLEKGIKRGEKVAVMSLKNELVAIGTAMMDWKEMLERRRGLAIKVEKVFIERDVYPRK